MIACKTTRQWNFVEINDCSSNNRIEDTIDWAVTIINIVAITLLIYNKWCINNLQCNKQTFGRTSASSGSNVKRHHLEKPQNTNCTTSKVINYVHRHVYVYIYHQHVSETLKWYLESPFWHLYNSQVFKKGK